MKNLQVTPSSKRLPGLMLALSLGWLVACGGPSKPAPAPAAPPPGPAAVANDSSSVTTTAGFVAPEIPAVAAPAPAGLMGEVVISKPNSQLTQIGLFGDSVSPGAGAFITPLTFMKMLGGTVGVQNLEGVDLNGPLYVLVLDVETVVLVVTPASEAAIRSSIDTAGVQMVSHGGFVAIGGSDALTSAAPYALSNLVKQNASDLPTVNLHVAKIMAGPHGDMARALAREQLRRFGTDPRVMNMLMEVLGNVSMLRARLDAGQQGITFHLESDVTGGPVQSFIAAQRPSTLSMLERIGTGPWGLAVGGRLDFTVFAPLLVAIGEAEANPILTQIAAQIPSLNGEMAMALNLPAKPEFVMAMDLADPKGISQIIDTLMALASKQKSPDLDGMKATLKLQSIRTRGGSLHELRAKPATKHQKELYGKSVSGFLGVAVNSLIATFGKDSKKHAKTLTAANGKIPGKGTKLSAAMALSKSARESLIIAVDGLSLSGQRTPTDAEPLVLGVGFEENTVRARIVVPMEHVQEATKLF